MKQTLLLAIVSLAITAVAGAAPASYKVTILDTVTIDGKDLKAGEYKVEVKDTTAVIRNGKDSTEVKVKTESGDTKYNSTSVRYTKDGGKNNLEEIHIGGTKTKLVFESPKTANGGE
jgi:hypothetical protein